MSSGKERFFLHRTLACLVSGLTDHYTLIDLRNDASVVGLIAQVDGFMNVSMVDVVFVNPRGDKYKFDSFFVQSRNIRYVHIPENMQIANTIERGIRVCERKPIQHNPKQMLKYKNAHKRHLETLASLNTPESSGTEKKTDT